MISNALCWPIFRLRFSPSLSSTPSADDTTQMAALPAMSFRLEASDEDDEQLTRRAFEVGTGNESVEDAPSTDPALAERRQRGA